jgi:hypothetical protein
VHHELAFGLPTRPHVCSIACGEVEQRAPRQELSVPLCSGHWLFNHAMNALDQASALRVGGSESFYGAQVVTLIPVE